jgi:hypothetical protein
MPSLPDLQQMREKLFAARANGLRSFRDQNGEEVTYSSDREMAAALAAIDREILTISGGRRPSTIRFQTSKGI